MTNPDSRPEWAQARGGGGSGCLLWFTGLASTAISYAGLWILWVNRSLTGMYTTPVSGSDRMRNWLLVGFVLILIDAVAAVVALRSRSKPARWYQLLLVAVAFLGVIAFHAQR